MDYGIVSYLAPRLALLTFAALVFRAAVSDILTYTVPNRLALAIALLYPVYVISAGQPVAWHWSLGVAAAGLVSGFVVFALGLWGGGDAKLFAAVALWAGPDLIVPLLICTTLAGGVIAIFVWLQHRISRAPSLAMTLTVEVDPDLGRQEIPYAAAIAVGALYVAFTLLKLG